jgi:6,7-dimethyl-8-ribityllumazine synthase
MAQSTDSNSLLDISGLSGLHGKKVALIGTEWNDRIVAALVDGAKRIALQSGVVISHELYVPGCVELPFATRKLWDETYLKGNAPDAIILFGAVIRGGTPHFDYVCKMVTEGALQLNLTLPVSVIFGVLTLDDEQQAWERLGGSHGHKGEEAMITAMKMIALRY